MTPTKYRLFPGICQESVRPSDRPYPPDWIVSHVSLAPGGYNSFYPLYVAGTMENGQSFYWNVPATLSWRYDFTNATYGPGVLDDARQST
jgi:hypothetical protein